MTDEPFSVPNRPMAPLREPRPGDPVWTLAKGPRRLAYQLEHDGWTGLSPRVSPLHGHRRE